MEILGFVVLVAALVIGYHQLRKRWLKAWCRTHGLQFLDAPVLEQQAALGELFALCHSDSVCGWFYAVHGRDGGAELRLQEQQTRRGINGNQVWHCLVVWVMSDLDLPTFRLDGNAAAADRLDAQLKQDLEALHLPGVIGGAGARIAWFSAGLMQPWRLNGLLADARRLRDLIAHHQLKNPRLRARASAE